MEKGKLYYFIDVLLTLAFLVVAISGVLKFPLLKRILALKLPVWLSVLHDWSGIVMAILVLIHLILHWNWIVAMTKNIFMKKN